MPTHSLRLVAALAGAAVSVKCASGNATATAASDGAYSVTISGAGLPCAIRITGSAGEVFVSRTTANRRSTAAAVDPTPVNPGFGRFPSASASTLAQ